MGAQKCRRWGRIKEMNKICSRIKEPEHKSILNRKERNPLETQIKKSRNPNPSQEPKVVGLTRASSRCAHRPTSRVQDPGRGGAHADRATARRGLQNLRKGGVATRFLLLGPDQNKDAARGHLDGRALTLRLAHAPAREPRQRHHRLWRRPPPASPFGQDREGGREEWR